MNPRIVFMGSPEFATPSLRALVQEYQVVGVVTQPDRPAGRGQSLTPPPVKILSEQLNLACIQPRRLREPEAMRQLQDWKPDLIVVVAFGQILRPEVLDLPPYGCLNVHASLLPRWRGAAPIQAAILHGDTQTGVTIMKLDPGIDSGPTLTQRIETIRSDDTAGSLAQRLSVCGAELLLETIHPYLEGKLNPQRQDESLATYAPQLKKEDGRLDFYKPALDLARRVQAFNPWPGAYTYWQGQILKIHRSHAVDAPPLPPGQSVIYQGMPAMASIQGWLVLEELQPAGKKPMPGKSFLQGAKSWGKQ
jgi:methionyl-tRNA formyltransferase